MSTKPALSAEAPKPAARQGVMLVIASPSGAGKSTLSQLLLQKDGQISMSVSCTTRPRRPSEVDGLHYHFVKPERFAAMRAGGELLEWAEVHGNFYGTPRSPVEQALSEGRDILFDIDFQGTLQLYKKMRPDIVSVFILPPDAATLKTRLERRAEDSPEVIARRLRTAVTELRQWDKFDHVIVNDDLDRAFNVLKSILAAARAATSRNAAAGAMAMQIANQIEKSA